MLLKLLLAVEKLQRKGIRILYKISYKYNHENKNTSKSSEER